MKTPGFCRKTGGLWRQIEFPGAAGNVYEKDGLRR
jgi:hypothetical protein